jgi:competence protein ComEA
MPIHPIKRWVKNYFGLSARETRGLLVLFLLMAGLLSIQWIQPLLFFSQPPSMAVQQAHLDSLVAQFNLANERNAPEVSAPQMPLALYTAFDPNRVSRAELISMGVEKGLAQRWENYLAKGGRFKKAEDIQRLYGMTEAQFQALAPYLAIEPPPASNRLRHERPARGPNMAKEETRVRGIFDLNLADTLQLQQVNGIGPVLSKRIIERRNKLGGFVHWQQLTEVYGLKEDVIEKLKDRAIIAPEFLPHQIAINTSDKEQLAAHPYITFATAQALITYRQQHGPYTDSRDLYKIHRLDSATILRILPYLSFQNNQ